MATVFQTINKSIISTTVSLYWSKSSVVSGEKVEKESVEAPDSSLVGCGTLSTGKGDFPQGISAYNFRIDEWENNGILFTKIGELLPTLLKINYLKM
jgi:hypothetical protein